MVSRAKQSFWRCPVRIRPPVPSERHQRSVPGGGDRNREAGNVSTGQQMVVDRALGGHPPILSLSALRRGLSW